MDYLPYVLLAVFLLMSVVQWRVLWLARRQQGRKAPDYGRLLSPAQRRADRLLFYFHSPRCGPCRSLAPVVEQLAEAWPNVVKVDVAGDPELARAFGVRATPAFVLVEKGIIARMLVGPVSRQRLEHLLAGG